MSFAEKLTERYNRINSLLCVGLDPRPADLSFTVDSPNPRIIAIKILAFVKKIINSTQDLALAYKANSAFFEQFGIGGHIALASLRGYIPTDIPFILDAKRGDIADTADAYATAVFEQIHADAVTVNGYLGSDGVLPFAYYPEHGVFVLCRTSNPSAGEIQDLDAVVPVYIRQAGLARKWNTVNNIGLVVGANCPQEMENVRRTCPDMWILAPGVGAQGGYIEQALRAGYTDFGGILINVGRGISNAKYPREAALGYVQQMREIIRDLESQGYDSLNPGLL
jgi:uridine monophosphate synthetase